MKSRLQADKTKCFICNKGGELHPHHIFNGGLKKKSEEYGYIIYVHNLPCHRQIHDDPSKAKALKMCAQEDFELDHTRELFMSIFKKNYL